VRISGSQGEKALRIRELALSCCELTTSDPKRRSILDDLGIAIERMMSVIYGYTFIDDEAIDSDDEIINWTFVDVSDDLNAANWNICCGFYKAAAACLRNALDMAIAALYFQARTNQSSRDAQLFVEWDRGDRDTPNWGETTTYLKRQASIYAFDSKNGTDICAEIYEHFRYLCNFTHGRPSDPRDRSYTNSVWMGGDTPGFDGKEFQRLVNLAAATTTWIVTIWLIAYPEILKIDPLGDSPSYLEFKDLLSNHLGNAALNFAINKITRLT
jgi:hypothetical protein